MICLRLKDISFILIIIFYNCASGNANQETVNQDDLQLKFVFILMRHLNRAPMANYQNNPNHIVWPRGPGQLTDEGIQNAYRAGKLLRQRYWKFLHPLQRYEPSEIDVSSTEVDRCYNSAAYLLAGMYPPNEDQKWNEDLKWQPIPIKTSLSKDHFNFARNPTVCPKYAMELREACENLMKTDKVQNFVNYLKNYTSSPLDTFFRVIKIADVIWTEHMANYPIPQWAMERYNEIEEMMLKCMTTLVETDQMKRLYSGEMINDVLTRMEALKNKSPEAKKIYLHVGHDSSIVSFLESLHIKNVTYPVYGAAVVMELYETSSNETVVKLLYNKDHEWNESNIQLLELPGCPQPCRLEDWRRLTQQKITHNLIEECKISN